MTSEQRLDRLERIAKLFVRGGMRARRNMREMDEKINIMIDAQIRNDERFAKSDERFAKFEERCAEYDRLFAKNDERFKEIGRQTDRTLTILMGLVRERQNGSSENPSPKH